MQHLLTRKNHFHMIKKDMFDRETTEYKTYLESATTKELLKMADQAGISIPPDLDRIFIIRELLDNMLDEDSVPYSSSIMKMQPSLQTGDMSPLALKTAALPEQYHITYLEVLPRDPQWVYIFWEIKAMDRERYEADPRFEGYALKALENKKNYETCLKKYKDSDFTESFTVPVGKEDDSWYLGFPSPGLFRIVLWVRGINSSIIISRPFVLPPFLNSLYNKSHLASPLIELSGVSDFSVLRSAERESTVAHE